MNPFHIVIPARLASTRLPDKALADLGGKPMVVRVAERAAQSAAASITVATDHPAIAQACQAHNIACIMTAASHESGTTRLAEAALLLGFAEHDLIVNVQGDEPLIDPQLINDTAECLARGQAPMATAACPIHDSQSFLDPNCVKVIANHNGHAQYFSRAPIPYPRDAFAQNPHQRPPQHPALRHIGIYAYRCGFLQHYTQLPPSPWEQWESLEQLRVLWHGHPIALLTTDTVPAAGVDTPEDLERMRQHFATQAT